MASTTSSIRLNYGSSHPSPALPASYQLKSWYGDEQSIAPKRLDITATGYFLDGIQIPLNGTVHFDARVQQGGIYVVSEVADVDNFLMSWLQDTANSSKQGGSDSEELALSFYSPADPVGPFLWGTFEFEEDKSTVVGIVARQDGQGNQQICYLTGTKAALPAVPSAAVRKLPEPPGATDFSEMLTLTFPGLTQATCDVMNEDFGWAMDQQWRSKLMSSTRPDIRVGLPASAAQARLAFLDQNAEWFNTVFGPASLGYQLYQDSLPGAANHIDVEADRNLNSIQVQTLETYLNSYQGKRPEAQHEHLMAANVAHFRQNPRLLAYADQGQAFLNRLEQTIGGAPSVVTFLGLATMNPQFQNPAMKLTGRYAGLLGALDMTGNLEQQFRSQIVAVTLLHLGDRVTFQDKNDMAQSFADLFQYIKDNPAADQTLSNTLNELTNNMNLVGAAQNLEQLGTLFASTIAAAATDAGTQEGRVLRVASTASDKWNLKYPQARIGSQFVYAVCLGYSLSVTIRMFMNWADLTPQQRMTALSMTFQQAKTAINMGTEIYKGVTDALKSDKEIEEAVQKLDAEFDASLDDYKAAGGVVGKLKSMNPNVLEDAQSWLGKFISKTPLAAGEKNPLALFDGAEAITKFLGPVTAAVTLCTSIWSLVSDIRSGAGALKISMDAVNVAIDTALVIWSVVDLVLDLAAVTVVGIVLAAAALVVGAVMAVIQWILGRKKPETPPEDYLEHVVRPFISELWEIQPAPNAQTVGVTVRGQALGASAA